MAIMKCPECGNDVSDKAEVCPHCGHKMAMQKCPECGNMISIDEKVCPHCGYKMQEEPAEIPQPEPSAAPNPNPKPKTLNMKIIGIVIAVIVVIALVVVLVQQGVFSTGKMEEPKENQPAATTDIIEETAETEDTESTPDSEGTYDPDEDRTSVTYHDPVQGVTFNYYQSYSVATLSDGITYVKKNISGDSVDLPFIAIFKDPGYSDVETYYNDFSAAVKKEDSIAYWGPISQRAKGDTTYSIVNYTYTISGRTINDSHYVFVSGNSIYAVVIKEESGNSDANLELVLQEILKTLQVDG